ncbi:MAG: ABC transporter permease [Proteobacteria bacterium]|nr:ABC transporter permease [Pseudomonadota bacterium]
MMLRSLFELTLCRLREFRREPSALLFVILVPIFLLSSIYLLTHTSVEDEGQQIVAITPASAERLHNFVVNDTQDTVNVSDYRSWFDQFEQFQVMIAPDIEIQELLAQKKIHTILRVNPPEQKTVKDTPLFQYVLASDNVDQSKFKTLSKISGVTQKSLSQNSDAIDSDRAKEVALMFHAELLAQMSGLADGQEFVYEIVTSKSLQSTTGYMDFWVPGFFALSILTTCLFGMGMTLVMSRRENLLKRYLTTPMSTFIYILSHMIARQLILLIEMVTIIGFSSLFFDVHIQGSFLLFFAVSVLGTLMLSFMAIVFASRTSNTSTYNSIANLFFVSMSLFSGIWFSTKHLPAWLATVFSYLPLAPLVESLRGVALHGLGWMDLRFELGIMTLYAVLFAFLGHYLFVWYESS